MPYMDMSESPEEESDDPSLRREMQKNSLRTIALCNSECFELDLFDFTAAASRGAL